MTQTNTVVVGGQAVNFWAEVFQEEEPEIQQYRPFTSADLDLHRPDPSATHVLRSQSKSAVREPEQFGKAFTVVSESFLIENKEGKSLLVQSLKWVAGLRPEEIRKATIIAEYAGVTIAVLNPIACLRAKAFNVWTLDQQHRQDEKHFRLLVPCVRAFVRGLLQEAESGKKPRPLLNALAEIIEVTSGRQVIDAARRLGLDLKQTLPWDDLSESRGSKIINFMQKQVPRWQHFLSTQ